MTEGSIDALLAEQIAYYDARAAEYDAALRAASAGERSEFGPGGATARWLKELAAGRDVLELACGSGLFTSVLAASAASLVAVDASREMLRLNERRVDAPNVERIEADVFDWPPPRRFGLVFFGFWLSHVPDERLERFWSVVNAALEPSGVVAFVDTGAGEAQYEMEAPDLPAHAVRRRLEDGREFLAVKVHREPAALAGQLAELGWEAKVEPLGERFFYGTAQRRRRSRRQ